MTTWYAAHIIEYARFLDGVQDSYSLYENIVLIEAETLEEARNEAARIGQAETGGSVSVNGRDAEMVFAGIRKLIACADTVTAEREREHIPFRPAHGTEVSYSFLEIGSTEEFKRFVDGESVQVWYLQ